jgi:hypothetical protein
MTPNTWRNGAAAALLSMGLGAGAAAQPAELRPGWSFDVAPYLWLPTISGNLRYHLPQALDGSASVKADAGDYFEQLNAALLLAATARHGRFTLLTDIMYVSAEAGGSRVQAVDLAGVGRNPISSTANVSGSSSLNMTLWTLAGGYTLAAGPWGNIDALAGFRYLGVEARTDYNLAVTLQGPRGNAGPSFGGAGRLSGNQDIWNGIIGVRGRVNIGASSFFLPYYLDIGGGDSNLTWQGFTGIGYRTGWGGMQLGWRYLSYEQGGRSLVQDVAMSGAYLAVNLRF